MSFTPLLEALFAGAIVITPTNRLQRDILWLYNQSSALKVTPKPKCMTYGSWISDWYQTHGFQHPHGDLARLIDNWQFQLLWKTLACKPLKHFEMQQVMSVIKNCALCLSPPQGSDFLYTPFAQEFQDTWHQVETALKQKNLIAPHQLPGVLAQLPYPNSKETPEIIWACFDYLHPEQQLIYQHLQHLNIKQRFYDLNCAQTFDSPEGALKQLQQAPNTHECYLYKAPDEHLEYQQMIHWVKTKWAQGIKRIGVVIPDLSQQIVYIRRLFKQHLPEEHLHFSLGQPLTDFPLVKHGLALLTLDINQRLTRHQCRLLLHSPFIELSFEERLARQQIYQFSPLLQEPELTFSDFIQACQKSCPKWCEQLKKIQALPQQATSEEWIKHIRRRWQSFGFPGYQLLDENNRQLLEKLYNAVLQLYSAAVIIEQFDQQQVFSELKQICKEQIHQPPQNYHGIHVMGWLESSGFCGQALWLCHLHSQLLPQAVQFTPMLPLSWQKQKQFPRTNNAKEYQLAQQMLFRLMHGQNQVVLSYAELKQQQVLWPSPILPSHLKAFTAETIAHDLPLLESFREEFLVPFQGNVTLGNGTSQLSLHAQCPFKAFAKYRLKTEQNSKEQFGLGPLDKGQVIHQILQHLWLKIENQQNLLTLSDEALEMLIKRTIHEHFKSFSQSKPYSLDPISTDLELELLFEKISQVLTLDKKRPYFKIDALEQKYTLTINEHQFKMRFDRVDELADGTKVVIDYKLNVPSPLPWLQDRPYHPQMLMYALAEKNLQGLVFFPIHHTKDKKYKLSGFASADFDIDGLTVANTAWQDIQLQWQNKIETYITEIQLGHCVPTPSQQSCKNCIHQDLCRVSLEELEE